MAMDIDTIRKRWTTALENAAEGTRVVRKVVALAYDDIMMLTAEIERLRETWDSTPPDTPRSEG